MFGLRESHTCLFFGNHIINTKYLIFISMKHLIIILIIFTFTISCLSQENQMVNIEMSSSHMTNMCDSIIGPVYHIPNPIPTYVYLESNGYCYFLQQPQATFTLCFNFIAAYNGVYLNTGFTTLGCTNVSFTMLELCDKTDGLVVGQGQFFNNLIIGHEYVWCITGNVTGSFFCQGLTTICPYRIEVSVLPVELTSFTATQNNDGILIRWVTMSESNSDYFKLERSKDLYTFTEVTKVKSSVYSNRRIDYEYLDKTPYDGIFYYRLTQVDLDGARKVYDPIYVNMIFKKPVKIFDVFGNSVDTYYNGLKIIMFEDGTIVKYY